jgi:TRAP-type C4-dicarboxylate transport system substrate-binding protein
MPVALGFVTSVTRRIAGGQATRSLLLLLAFLLLGGFSPEQQGQAPMVLKVIGGHANSPQYLIHEVPFWTQRVPALTHGQVRAEIAPFDGGGIQGRLMLPLLQLGVFSLGTVPLGMAAADDPELNVIDLPTLNPNIAALRQSVALWRSHLQTVLRDRYGVELLAVYTQSAQVVFCQKPFASLEDLIGRQVRTSSVAQSELVETLRGVPIVIPFAQTVDAVRHGVVECAITGALAGNYIGLHEVMNYISIQGVSWPISVFVAKQTAWNALPEEVRARLREGLAELEEEIWEHADQIHAEGFACNAGLPTCRNGQRGQMVIVYDRWSSDARRVQLLGEAVLPKWVARCGSDCAEAWNRIAAPILHIWAAEENSTR